MQGWGLRTRRLALDRPLLMGVVNVTPDSFSDGGEFLDADRAVAHGLELIEAGADILDVGGESTRPGAEGVSAAEELERVIDVVGQLASAGHVVSIDTTKSEVARACVEAGAEIINDIAGMRDEAMRDTAAECGAGVVLMHMQGTPRNMQDDPHYEDVVSEVKDWLKEAASALETAGVPRERIVLDPGIGFGKTVQHNLELLDRLDELSEIGYPVAVGASRKSFLARLTGVSDTRSRDVMTAIVTALVIERGASVVRVHDVASSRLARELAMAFPSSRI